MVSKISFKAVMRQSMCEPVCYKNTCEKKIVSDSEEESNVEGEDEVRVDPDNIC
jgi:hypothetical protein